MPPTLNLAGLWRVCLDAPGSADTPPPPAAFAAEIALPATTETAGLGPLNADWRADRLTAVRRVDGPAWFERMIDVPLAWSDHTLYLLIERTKAASVWLDGRPLATHTSLTTPLSVALGMLTPGPHRLTLQVDNRRRPAPGDNHQWSEHTQGNWAGLLGRLEIVARCGTWIEHVAVAPDLAARALRLTVTVRRTPSPPSATGFTLTASTAHGRAPALARGHFSDRTETSVELLLLLTPTAPGWDETCPALHRVTVTLVGAAGTDEFALTTGLREIRRVGTQLVLNGRPLFLRGEVNCCVYPLTGHPPMDVPGWRRYFATLQAHGLNHVRFHSWTPPDAAFTAADELGCYVQTELPFWGAWTPAIAAALRPEAEAILRAYGHHPSFVLFSLGNEHSGDRDARRDLVDHLRRIDPQRLYAQGANNDLATPSLAPGDDVWITARLPSVSSPGHYTNVRGAHATPDRADGHLQVGPGGTRSDYRGALAASPLPVIGHEIGQYSTYPRYEQIARYTGVFAAHNLARFRARAAAAGLLARSPAFARASAALAARCYREEIEAALRTPGFGGFQLLGLQDFPGQGTALVGLLDAFLTPKTTVTPAAFRAFCGPQVLLARFERHTWRSGETFRAELELAHYGARSLPAGPVRWTLADAAGTVLTQGELAAPAAPAGGLRPLGRLAIVLPAGERAAQLTLTLRHLPSEAATEYPLWHYPAPSPAAPPPGVSVATACDEAAAALAAGGRVLLCADANRPYARSPGGGFTPDFWCWSMFKNTPGTLGLVCDAGHAALAGFPTEEPADWQWWHLARAAQPVPLDGLDAALQPIVEVIDNPERAQRLGLLWEVRVGPGRLLVCAIDLAHLAPRHPEAAALRASLLAYAASPAFAPQFEISVAELTARFAAAAVSPST